MEDVDLNPAFGIQTTGSHVGNPNLLPKELITGAIRCADGSTRCHLRYLENLNQGGYGRIQRVERTDASGQKNRTIVCKRPIQEAQSTEITQEAILQHLAQKTLSGLGFIGAVPCVYDIYRFGDEQRFTMDYIEGCSALEEIYKSANPGTTFLQVLAQTCVLLLILDVKLGLDHRDLKLTNLWIRRGKPIHYGVNGYTVAAPFQVVLLDFGFACLGDRNRISTVNLGGGVFPELDPCPKDGRNLFQLLTGLVALPALYDRMGADVREEIEDLLKGYVHLARQFLDPAGSWVLPIVGDPTFSYPPLHPGAILGRMAQRWPKIVKYEQ